MAWMVMFDDEPTKLGLRATHGDKHSAYVRSGDPVFKDGVRANVRIWHWTKGVWDGRLPG